VNLLVTAAPALPLHSAGKYVAGAYLVFLVLVLVYVAIMATRLSRTERELAQLREDLEASNVRGERELEAVGS
jgi:flagellar biosynthesis/type III secretory pathway M-ring protein FliF/YscJ